jgi:integrase/recombinase XerD
MMLGALVRMLSVLEPAWDWGPLARVYNHLRQTTAPSRDKLSRMVPATDLFELGLRLMDTCKSGADRPAHVVTRFRDGLLIALLIACPIRIKNLANLVIGQHLVFDGDAYLVKLTATETKTGRPYVAAVPPELTPYLDRWLEIYRRNLQTFARGQTQSAATFGSAAMAGRCASGRSGTRSKSAPGTPSASMFGRIFSGLAP